jgi:hypothetical protein
MIDRERVTRAFRAIAQPVIAVYCAICAEVLPVHHHVEIQGVPAAVQRYVAVERGESSDGGDHLPESNYRVNIPSASYSGTASVDTLVKPEPWTPGGAIGGGAVPSITYGY